LIERAQQGVKIFEMEEVGKKIMGKGNMAADRTGRNCARSGQKRGRPME